MPLVIAASEEALEKERQKMQASPSSPSFKGDDADQADDPDVVAAKNMKPMLGFLPPLERRDAHLLRARKSKYSKKTAMRAMDGSL